MAQAVSAAYLQAAFDELVRFANRKRELLTISATKRKQRRKALNIMSGVLALLSGGAITIVLTKYVDSDALKVLSAVTAFSSGLISLFLTSIYDDKETQKMYDGAGKFLGLREEVRSAAADLESPAKRQLSELKKLREQYVKLSQEYDPLSDLRLHGEKETFITAPSGDQKGVEQVPTRLSNLVGYAGPRDDGQQA